MQRTDHMLDGLFLVGLLLAPVYLLYKFGVFFAS